MHCKSEYLKTEISLKKTQMSTSWWCSNSFCCRVSEPVEHYSGQVSVTVCPGRWNSHRRCSTWLYVQTCLALHSANWKNGRCNPWWRFLLLYEPKSVSHTFLSVHVHLINTAADKTVQHQLSATTPSQRYWFFFLHSLHPQTLPHSCPDATRTYNNSDIKW